MVTTGEDGFAPEWGAHSLGFEKIKVGRSPVPWASGGGAFGMGGEYKSPGKAAARLFKSPDKKKEEEKALLFISHTKTTPIIYSGF